MMSNYIEQATILMVDDNLTNLKVLCSAIADSGWEILVATDGSSAIEQAEYAQPHLILLDVMMPEIDGFETCRRLKTSLLTHDIPIIFMTALTETVDKVYGLSIGGVDYITKPFHTEEVLARISVHLKLQYFKKQLEKQKSELEIRVSERTKELQSALEELKQSQLQLVQNEKMSTLGQLVAGVAHEINNPVGFLTGGLSQISEYTLQLINHLKLYHQHYPEPVAEITQDAKKIILKDILQDIPEVISSMNVGIERICNISTSLRSFSRSDADNKILFNIHEGIDSTLMILKHRLKANNYRPEIEVIKEYGDLPLVLCYPGQLNQVFMNIMANAIDALDELNEADPADYFEKATGKISISTSYEQSKITISIKDSAAGIPDETKSRIFEQFFTTKPIGKGTGLGLSISRQIVEIKHKGQLNCISSAGSGTEFIIEIPTN